MNLDFDFPKPSTLEKIKITFSTSIYNLFLRLKYVFKKIKFYFKLIFLMFIDYFNVKNNILKIKKIIF